MKTFAAFILVFTSCLVHGAPASTELLMEVNPDKAQRLREYNQTFLLDELYFSKRHRIVEINTELLLEGGDFTITPFDDVVPIHFRQETFSREPDKITLIGFIQAENPSQATGYDISPRIQISVLAWDLDESDNAFLSILNRRKYSEHWEFDEFNTPKLETLPDEVSAVAGPPPTSPEEIERYKRLKTLRKHQFYSVSTIFTSPDGKKFILKPLEYTPRYSVIQEIDDSKTFAVIFDLMRNEIDNRSDDDKEKAARYNAFRNSLIKEEGKAVKGDLP